MKTLLNRTFLATLFALFCLLSLLLTACDTNFISSFSQSGAKGSSAPASGGSFQEYELPKAQSGLMRPTIDHKGRVWFGEMGHNFLTMFDPTTQGFKQITPPGGKYGIMGVTVGSDDTIWFAEEYANYIGHYLPATGKFKTYTLPRLSIPDTSNAGKQLSITSAPNDLALDSHGNIWFTELNADAIGKLDPGTGQVKTYPLEAKRTIQKLSPYGITIDARDQVWFTQSSNNRLGRLDPQTGKIQYFTTPIKNITLMEIAHARNGQLWMTSFMGNLILNFNPVTSHFSSYEARANNGGTGGVYGLTLDATSTPWLALSTDNAIARLDPRSGRFTYYTIPTPESIPLGIVENPQARTFWFTESQGNKIGMLKP